MQIILRKAMSCNCGKAVNKLIKEIFYNVVIELQTYKA